MNRLTRRAALGVAAALAVAPQASAQAWPIKPVRFLVPYPVGGNGNVYHTNLEMNF